MPRGDAAVSLREYFGRGAAMVYFSDRDDVKRWLDAIEPARRRREVAMGLAARAALRVLPLLGAKLARNKRAQNGVLLDSVSSCLHVAALPWVAAKYPTRDIELRVEAIVAADAAVVAASAAALAKADYAAGAANATACAVEAVASDDAIAGTIDAIDAATTLADAAAFSADSNTAFDPAAVIADAQLIESGRSGVDLYPPH